MKRALPVLGFTREDVQAVADVTAEALGFAPPRFTRWNPNRGWSNPLKGTFSLPRWIQFEDEPYALSYVLHEVAHHHPRVYGHGVSYLRVEEQALALWGLKVVERTQGWRGYMVRLATESGTVIRPSPGTVFAGKEGRR